MQQNNAPRSHMRENIVPRIDNEINTASDTNLERNPSTLELSNVPLPNIVATHDNNNETNNDTRSPTSIVNKESFGSRKPTKIPFTLFRFCNQHYLQNTPIKEFILLNTMLSCISCMVIL